MLMLTLQRTVEALGAWTALALTECMAGEEGRRSNPAFKAKQTMKKEESAEVARGARSKRREWFHRVGGPWGDPGPTGDEC